MNSKNTNIIFDDSQHGIETALNIPVLMYHSLGNKSLKQNKYDYSPYHIPSDQFRQQMEYLVTNNYRSLQLQSLIALLHNHDVELNRFNNKVAITFDDGYADNFQYAVPILTDLGLTATFFVIVKKIDTPGYLTWQQLRFMIKSGMNIQSHTMTHRPIESLSSDAIEEELVQSKSILEHRLGIQVDFLSLPHGSYTRDWSKIAKKADYIGCCTSEVGYFNLSSDPYHIKRLAIRKKVNDQIFNKIIRHDVRLLTNLKRNNKYKNMIKNIIGIDNYNIIFKIVFGSRQLLYDNFHHRVQ